MRFAHDSHDRDLSGKISSRKEDKLDDRRTPLAVLIGLALSFGSKAARRPSGTAEMISTRRGLPASLFFLLTLRRSTFKSTVSLFWCAFASSPTISLQLFIRASAWDGAPMINGCYKALMYALDICLRLS